jgi:hypothetical protein
MLSACSDGDGEFPPDATPSGIVEWSVRFKGEPFANAVAVSFDGSDVIVAGNFEESVDIRERRFTSRGEQDSFVARLSGDGDLIWAYQLGGAGFDAVLGLAIADDGSVIVKGTFGDTLTIGSETLAGHIEFDDVFLTKLDRDGNAMWGIAITPTYRSSAWRAVDVAADGSAIIAATVREEVDLGSGPLRADEMMIARYSAAGEHLWSQSRDAAVFNVAALPDGSFAFGGLFQSPLAIGGDTLEVDCDGCIGFGILVGKLRSNGDYAWSRGFGLTEVSFVGGRVAAGAAGSIVLGSEFRGTLTLDSYVLESGTYQQLFVAELDADSGSVNAAGVYDERESVSAESVAVTPGEDLIAVVGSQGNALLGNTMFVAMMTAFGAPVWAIGLGNPDNGDNRAVAVDIDDQGRVAIAGWLEDDGYVAVLAGP